MGGYFLYHSIGTFPGKAAKLQAALADYANIWSAADDAQWPTMLAARNSFIDSWGRLIGAPQGSLTTTENVTLALYSIIAALPQNSLRGRKILTTADCFPSLHFLLAGLQARFGFELVTVPFRPGDFYIHDEDLLAAWQEDVALALINWVSSTTSKRMDLQRISRHARQKGSLVIADITQGVGIVPFAVDDLDMVIGSSLKWLCGSSGAGMVYVKPSLLPQLEPELRGWFSQPNPFSWDLDGFAYAGDMRRFDHGTPAVLAAIASQPGLDFVEATGIDRLMQHNRQATALLCQYLQSCVHCRLVSPDNIDERGGSLMLEMASVESAAATYAALKAENYYCDQRNRILRFSPGIVTELAEVEALGKRLQRLA